MKAEKLWSGAYIPKAFREGQVYAGPYRDTPISCCGEVNGIEIRHVFEGGKAVEFVTCTYCERDFGRSQDVTDLYREHDESNRDEKEEFEENQK